MSQTTIVYKTEFGGGPVTPDTIVLKDSSNTYGVRRQDTGATVVSSGTSMIYIADGRYGYTFDDPISELTYDYSIEWTYLGNTYTYNGEITAGTGDFLSDFAYGNHEFGDQYIGGPPTYTQEIPDPERPIIKSEDQLPPKQSTTELFKYVSEHINYLIDKYSIDNVQRIINQHNTESGFSDPDYLLKYLGTPEFIDLNISDTRKRTLVLLVSQIMELKGTFRGLTYLTRMLGLNATVEEWYDINEKFAQGDPEFPEEVDECSIILNLGVVDNTLDDSLEDQIQIIIDMMLWVCVKLAEIRWTKALEDQYIINEDGGDQLLVGGEGSGFGEFLFDGHYPEADRCANPFVYGEPYFPDFPKYGEPLAIYDYSEWMYRSEEEYNAINYNGVPEQYARRFGDEDLFFGECILDPAVAIIEDNPYPRYGDTDAIYEIDGSPANIWVYRSEEDYDLLQDPVFVPLKGDA